MQASTLDRLRCLTRRFVLHRHHRAFATPSRLLRGTKAGHEGLDLVLEDVRVVLVAPKTASNIGAVARACGNFEAPHLWVVAPRCDPRSEEVARLACDTFATDRMVLVDSLEAALADTIGSVGFTRRAGATRYTHACLGDMLQQFPEALPGMQPGAGTGAGATPAARPGTTALVFGREESGLTESELRLVGHACAIPSGRVQPSLNLSHAVTVVLSECFNRRLHDQQLQAQLQSEQQAGPASSGAAAAASSQDLRALDPGSQPFWLQGGLGGTDGAASSTGTAPAVRPLAEYASASEVEHLVAKVAAAAEAVGISPAERSVGQAHGRTRLPVGHFRALLGRAKVTASEARSLHGLMSSIIDKLSPGHPLGSKRAKQAVRRLQQQPQEGLPHEDPDR